MLGMRKNDICCDNNKIKKERTRYAFQYSVPEYYDESMLMTAKSTISILTKEND